LLKRTFLGIVLTLLLTATLSLGVYVQPVRSEPRTWTVDDDGPADFDKIQDAVNAVSPGDTIYVYNGIYYEHVVINLNLRNNLTIVGQDKFNTIIDGSGTGSVVTIEFTKYVNFTGFTVRNGWDSIWLRDNDFCTVCDCIVCNSGTGIALLSWEYVSHNNTIRGNIIFDVYDAIINYMDNTAEGHIIAENTIYNFWGSGIYFNFPYKVQVMDNNIAGNGYPHGIHFEMGGSENIVIGNTVSWCAPAIEISYADNNIIGANTASDSSTGIELYESNNNTVINNVASNNYYGITLSASNNNTIYHNNFIGNTQQAYIITPSLANLWDNGYPSGGNHWSDYTGPDSDLDGIVDFPYVIDSDNQDRYPLVSQYIPWVHDVAVTDLTLSKTAVGQHSTMLINFAIENQGDFTETFNIIFYANETASGTFTTTLYMKVRSNFKFMWNATNLPKGNYTITAHITPVEGETDTDDNNFTRGWVFVTIAGDVTSAEGPPDCLVDMRDIGYLCTKFGTTPSSLGWDPNCDITGSPPGNPDDIVDMRDIGIACTNFMKDP